MDALPRKTYPSDLTDAQWAIVAPLLPPPVKAGAPRTTDLREVLNAIFYLLANGCAWHALPHDFPPKGRSATTSTAGAEARCGSGSTTPCGGGPGSGRARGPRPAPAASTARPSRRVGPPEPGGTTRGKKINGIKRHLLVDTLGLVLAVVVHSAKIQDRDGAKPVFARAKLRGPWPRMQRVWADGGYAGKLFAWVSGLCQWVLEIVKRSDDVKGFELLPKRWVVERTFSWLANYRRLSQHYEYRDETGEAMSHLAMIHLMRRRLTKEKSLNGAT